MTGGRVVQVVRSDAFAGVERYVVETATELRRRRWDVVVVGGEPQRMRAELPDDIEHRPAATVREVARQLRSAGSFDVVHAHMTAAELPAALLKRKSRLVVTRHFATPRGQSRTGRLAARYIERRMDAQIAISQFVADATDTPCTVIHNGVRPSELKVPREAAVVVLQRHEPEKDTATALQAWAHSGLARVGWRLLIYGRGSQTEELREMARGLRVTDSVEFRGFVEDSRAALAAAAVVVAPAPAEPFGLTVVEAMSVGTAVIAADGGAHRETLGSDGLYFPPGDVLKCAAQLHSLCADAEERARIGGSLRTRQRALFSIATHVTHLEEIYAGS
jgi:glycosyltransferase involved in cell wall biosynthesis